MIEVDVREFMAEGYLILRQVIPPEMLQPLRQSAERVLYRRWPQGISAAAFQPMIHGLERYIDEDSANLVEFCLHENVLGTTRQLMGGVEVAPSAIFMMYNPVRDFGPWWWHRDVSPLGTKGPLQGLQQDTLANGPVHLHWNIALYDDDVYWVVPRSHLRPNSEAENRQLGAVPHSYAHAQLPQGEKRHEPLPGSLCADLKAGDAIVNHLELFHWGSNYGPRQRRTYHIGYRTFEGPRYFYEGFSREFEFTRYLKAESRALYERWAGMYEAECNAVEALFRAVIERDEGGFLQGLAQLHPGASMRFVCLIHLCRIAQQMEQGNEAEFSPRFTGAQIQSLWQRFGPLDEALQTEEENYLPGLQIKGPSKYRLYELPEDFGIDEFVAGWSTN